ncbi:MAG: carboxylesterase/lipase family protein, partial [Solimonas sp.]
LRWRAPQPAAKWDGVRDATRYGNDCMQTRMSWDKTASAQPVSEDCLYLNVWAPANATAASKLPVIVWVYGGGFAQGSATAPVTDGSKLAARGAVIVSFNYRVARFGFFAHPALTREAADPAVGNYGLMDQVAALQWVQRNIAAFGGNAGNVTIWGESAGGESVNLLMLEAPARGLFHKAYSQSGGGRTPRAALSTDAPDLPSAESFGRKFAQRMKLKDETAAALRALPADKVLGGVNMISNDDNTYSGTMIDGKLVTAQVAASFAAGRQARVPYIQGSNSNELGFLPGFMLHGASKKIAEQFKFDTKALVAAYGSQDTFEERFASDATFVEPSHYLAGVAAAAGQPVYLFRFNYVTEANRKPGKGAAHATDVPYAFGNLRETGDTVSDGDRAAAQAYGDYIVSFARTGVPTSGSSSFTAYGARSDVINDFSEKGLAVMPAAYPAFDEIARHIAAQK